MSQAENIAKQMSQLLPTLIRHMYPYVFQPLKLPPSQVLAITTLFEKGNCHLCDLSHEMHISAPTVTGIINRLEKSGYVKRTADSSDRRAFTISLTAKGEKILLEFRENIRKRWQVILSQLPQDEQENILRTVTKITRGLTHEAAS
ncbi:MAG: MarR family transcriptional regulator [Candidatus Omnitrophota bacterium]